MDTCKKKENPEKKKKPTKSRSSTSGSKKKTSTLRPVTNTLLLSISPNMKDGHGSNLGDHELDLLRCSAEGDLDGLREIFVEQSYYLFPLNVNACDSLNRSSLSLAILNGHLEVVRFLLSDEIQDLQVGDELFYAIETECYDAIHLLLEKDSQTALKIKPGSTSPFAPNLTPFMLAAHRNNYKILNLLYSYTHRLAEYDCTNIRKMDTYGWDAVTERLLLYEALASPAYMLLMFNVKRTMSFDPLDTAMNLFKKLHELAHRENEVSETYLRLAQQCETFANDLLQEVRSANELADFMYYDLQDDDDLTEEEGCVYSRSSYLQPLDKAVKIQMKDFVTSDNAQLALIYLQKGKMFREMTGVKEAFLKLFLGCIYPILGLASYISPNSKMGRLLKNPTVGFYSNFISSVIFLMMLFLNMVLSHTIVFEDYGVPPLLTMAYFWIVGRMVEEIVEIYEQGLHEYLGNIWNWNDIFTIIFYTLFIIFRVISVFTTRNDGVFGGRTSCTDSLTLAAASDILIAITYILLYLRLMQLLRVERTFGPLQVSLDLMVRDALHFLVIFSIVFVAFGSAITELYAPYRIGNNCTCSDTTMCNISISPMVNSPSHTICGSSDYNTSISSLDVSSTPCVACKNTQDSDSLVVSSFIQLLEGLFWTVFGYGDPRKWYVFGNCPKHHKVMEIAGAGIIGMYHIVIVIVLVNMLIAMMSNSFQKTFDDAEREWKFYRTELWLKFVRKETHYAPPMNLIPRWRTIVSGFRKLKRWSQRCRKSCKKSNVATDDQESRIVPSRNADNSIEMKEKPSDNQEFTSSMSESECRYSRVLKLVAMRYIKKKVLRGDMVI